MDVVALLAAELAALERSVAKLGSTMTEHGAERGGEPDPVPEVGGAESDAAVDSTSPLTSEERRRLDRNLRALLDEVRQLKDLLLSGAGDPDGSTASR